MIIFVILNLVVLGSSLLLLKNFYSRQSRADRFLFGFLLYLAQILLVNLVLGITHNFFLPQVFLFHCLILSVLFLVMPQRDIIFKNHLHLDFILNNKLLLFSAVIFIGFFAVKCFVNLINPPTCPDSLQYHLAFPAYWLKNGVLTNPISVFGSLRGTPELSWATYYPINGELFFAWLMLPLKNVFFADLGEAPFYLAGIVAVYSILRKFSVKNTTALFSAFLWVLIPNLFKELKTGSQVDVISAVLFLLAFNCLLILSEKIDFKISLIFGVSLGMFIGTKITNIIWSMALVPMFVYVFISQAKLVALRKALGAFLAICLAVFIFGAYMYLKNFINSGNPVYPIRMELFNKFSFPGLIDAAVFRNLYSYNYPNATINKLFSEGLGLQLLFFILPGTFLPLIFLRLIKNKIKPVMKFLWLFLTPFLMFTLYCLFLNSGITRFLFPYLGMGLIAAVVFLNKLNWGDRYISVVGFIAIVASAAELAHRTELITSFIIAIVLFLALYLSKAAIIKIYNSINLFKLFIILLIISTGIFYFLNQMYNRQEFNRYFTVLSKKEAWQKDIALGWKWLNQSTGLGKRIAYVGRNETYPLLGSGWKNEVFYVPVNAKQMIPYDLSNGYYRKEKSLNDWEHNLKAAQVDFLYIALPQKINNESLDPKEFPVEDKWAAANPQIFYPVFSNSLVHIYKVKFSGGS